MLLARMDEHGKVAWLGLAVVAFWVAWPLGLAIFVFLVGSGRTRAWRQEARRSPSLWPNLRRVVGRLTTWSSSAGSYSVGNNALRAYQTMELDHLEDQGTEVKAFLDRLRLARDKREFDGFMAKQRQAIATQPVSIQHS